MAHAPNTGTARRSAPTWLRVLIPVALILAWLAVGSAGGQAFGEVNDVAENDQAQFLPASADATKVSDLQTEFRGDDVIPAILVFERDGGVTDADHEAISDIVDAVTEIDGVEEDGVSPAIDSKDGDAVQVIASLDTEIKPADTVEKIRGYLDDNTPEGLYVAVTGPAGQSADIVDAFSGLDGLLLIVALAVVLVILIVVYRSPMLPLIVLGTSMMALTAAMFTVVELAKADVLVLSGQTQGILMILVIGAATDYSLLYVSRYREALRELEGKWDATWAALRGSTPAILASGGTVIAGLLCLLVSDLNSNKALGPVAAIGIVFALIAALTLLPALLYWAGRAAFWPLRPTHGSTHKHAVNASSKGLWPAVARLVSRRPRMIWIASVVVLAAASFGLVGLKADGVSQSEFVTGHSEAREGQGVLDEHFPGGSGTPAVIVGPEDELQSMADTILATDGVDSLAVLTDDSASGTAEVTTDGIEPAFGPNGPVKADPTVIDGQIMLEATLEGPGDSTEAEETVSALREALPDTGDNAVLVGGVAATAIDTNAAAVHDRNLVIPLVLIVILIILMILLRSILAPVLLVMTVVLSFAAALGISSLVFNHLFEFPGADPSVPLFGFVFLVALGIDYNIFLMTRVREESVAHGTREGIARGLVATGGVITSAGIVLAATFAALGVLPILFLAQISFIVAFGVLLDTILVRSLLVPALSIDIGKAIWWPSKLSRTLN
ncbi:MMPL family transporter [Paramicrobacterium agarici]|uniref:MMPL family transporter n=1 Tax=Paramicrobacterium agarici TaxID=630514 RepID=UPI00114D863B|nr:MMPL family transporter [Microbacterium agarici]TQO23330.1 RND superfamily putative drug exporter [Microbacterium agarici]